MLLPHSILNEQRPDQSAGQETIVQSLIGRHHFGGREQFFGQCPAKDLSAQRLPGKHFHVKDEEVFCCNDGHKDL